MPIISAAVVNKQGKIILSRQFMDITRIRVEGLLSAFPKLLGGSNANKQCTFVETSAVRYVYQPVEQLLLVLITTKSSNIVEDLATLRLMGRVIPEYDNQLTEESLSNKAFEICFAFDEIIVGGHRENVTMDQIVTYLEMESHEEQLAIEEKAKQEKDAKKEARRKAHEIMKKKRETGGYGGIGASGGGGSGMGGGNGGGMYGDEEDMGQGGGAQHQEQASRHQAFSETAEESTPKPKAKSIGGMSFSKAKKKDQAAKVLAESGAPAIQAQQAPAAPAPSAQEAGAIDRAGVHIQIEEKVSAQLNRDGGLNAGTLSVSGDLTVTVSDANYASVRIGLSPAKSSAFTFKTHPNVNKAAFTSDNILAIKDGKPYPVHQSLSIVKWRVTNAAGLKLPLSITLWPGDNSASVEFELEDPSMELDNVVIQIPLGGAFPEVDECSVGNYTFDPDSGFIQWQIPQISAAGDSSGTMDIQLNKDVSADVFFPTQVAFSSKSSAAGVVINDVLSTETGVPVKYSSETALVTDEYYVN